MKKFLSLILVFSVGSCFAASDEELSDYSESTPKHRRRHHHRKIDDLSGHHRRRHRKTVDDTQLDINKQAGSANNRLLTQLLQYGGVSAVVILIVYKGYQYYQNNLKQNDETKKAEATG